MARLAVGAVGAAVGFMVGGPVGAQVGWALGTMAGGMLEKGETFEGPRLSDLAVTSSTYGSSINRVWGTVRVPGNIIWSGGIQEHRSEDDVGGKGGPSNTQVNYTYTADFAVGLCEGEIFGIRKIWADSRLIYDISSDVSVEELIASNDLLSEDGVSVYTGSETQEADPTIESYEGVGNVPAHRGLAYVVFNGFKLEKFGNRIPNITVEVVSDGETEYALDDVMSSRPEYNDSFYSEADDGTIKFWALNVTPFSYNAGQTMPIEGTEWTYDGTKIRDLTARIGIPSGWTSVRVTAPVRRSDGWFGVYGTFGGSTRHGWAKDGTTGIIGPLESTDGTLLTTTTADFHTSVYYDGDVYAAAGAPQVEKSLVYKFRSVYDPEVNGITPSKRASAVVTTARAARDVYVNADGVWVATVSGVGSGTLFIDQYDHDLVLVDSWSYAGTYIGWPGLLVSGDLAVFGGGTESEWGVFRLESDGSMTRIGNGNALGGGESMHPVVIADVALLVRGTFITFGLLSSNTVPLSDVVSDLCDSTGMSDYDVSALDDAVRGYVIARQTSARSAIQPLRQAYFFDLIESGSQLKAVKRGGASVASIEEPDLSAHPHGDTRPNLITVTRMQELELQKRVSVLYMNPDADYQQGEQYAARIITDAVNETTLDFPLVLSDDEAAQIADSLLTNAWVERERYDLSLSNEYLKLEPSDVVTVTSGGVVYTTRFAEINNSDGVLQVSATAEDASAYTSTAVGGDTSTTAQTVGLAGKTVYELMDIPLLRDHDDYTGFYVSGTGGDSWPGAVLYQSEDGEVYTASTALVGRGSIGEASTVLSDASHTVWDRDNEVTIRMIYGSISSAASELAVLNGANAALLGDEVIQFKNVTDNGDGTYTLDTLLRGRKGTDWATGEHATGDTFVLLEEGKVYRISQDNSKLDQENYFKGVTIGGYLQKTSQKAFTNTGVALKPLSVVLVSGSRDGSNNLTVTWKRRSRLSAKALWTPPLGEDSEAYEVDVMSTASPMTVLRTITSTASGNGSVVTPGSQQCLYDADDQTADGLTPGNPVTVRIYQLSETVGRGYVREETV